MIALTDQMRELIDNALANGFPCIVATASAKGEPDVSFKGSTMVFDGESLAYWERSKRQQLKNLLENPHVVVMFRDTTNKAGWRFHGVATVHEKGPIRDAVMARTIKAELDKDPERTGVAVIIRVDKVTDLGVQVLQTR